MKDRENLLNAAQIVVRERTGDGVALMSTAHPPGALERMADAIANGPLTVRWLQCSGAHGCGWRMEDGAVGVPVCPKCGSKLRIHARPA